MVVLGLVGYCKLLQNWQYVSSSYCKLLQNWQCVSSSYCKLLQNWQYVSSKSQEKLLAIVIFPNLGKWCKRPIDPANYIADFYKGLFKKRKQSWIFFSSPSFFFNVVYLYFIKYETTIFVALFLCFQRFIEIYFCSFVLSTLVDKLTLETFQVSYKINLIIAQWIITFKLNNILRTFNKI